MNFIGIDVSKQKLDCALIRSSLSGKPLHKKVANTPEGITTLLTWATKKADCEVPDFHVVLEATGPYHEVAAESLFEADCKVFVVNPARTRDFAKSLGHKTKTDKVDANVLARYAFERHTELKLWTPPQPHYRQLRTMQTRKQALETDLQRERNRLEKLQASRPDIFVMESIERMVIHLQSELELLEQAIETHVQAHPGLERDRSLLQSIQGIGPVLSTLLLPILQPGRFEKAPQAAAYIGVVPVEYQSGTSVNGRPRLSKAGDAVIRAKLYMAAIVAVRYNPDVKALYERLLAKGKSKMSALGAAMRKLVHICFGVLKHQTPYAPKIV
jgi:transposase